LRFGYRRGRASRVDRAPGTRRATTTDTRAAASAFDLALREVDPRMSGRLRHAAI